MDDVVRSTTVNTEHEGVLIARSSFAVVRSGAHD